MFVLGPDGINYVRNVPVKRPKVVLTPAELEARVARRREINKQAWKTAWARMTPERCFEAQQKRSATHRLNRFCKPRFYNRRKPKQPRGPVMRRPLTEEEMDQIALRKQLTVSIKAIMRDLVSRDPQLIEQALRDGLQADPPKSYPYLALAAAYLDGRPTENVNINATVSTFSAEALSRLSDEELEQMRRLQLKMLPPEHPNQLEAAKEPVTIDIKPIRSERTTAVA